MAVKINYQEGDKIGELTFINREDSQGDSPIAKFRCNCGNEFITRIGNAKNGSSKSCGCRTKELAKLKKKRYEAGHNFGGIVLINRIEDSNPSKARGVFLCYCGVEFETNITSIATKHTKSCGCYYTETRSILKNTYTEGEQVGTCFYIKDAAYKACNPRRATFRCFCGNYFVTAIQNLENGVTKSCGCSTRQFQRQAGGLPSRGIPQLSNEDIDRFWSFVDKKESIEECWNWKGSGERYGNFSLKGASYKANRVALFLKTGENLEGMEAMHICDNPKCCNIHHLEIGTHWENMQDMADKGRAYNGIGNKNSN